MRRAALGVAAALPWLGALGGRFVSWDDGPMAAGNPLLALPWSSALPAFLSSTYMSAWQPLGWVLYKLLRDAGGGSPFPFHAAALLLHGLNAALLLAALERLLPRARPQARAAAALLWAWHPVQAESVAWVSVLSDLLCGSFVLGSLLAHLRGRRGAAWGLAAAAALCRWKALAAPVLALALDLHRGARGRELARRHAGYAAVAALAVAANAKAKATAGYALSLRPHEAALGLLLQARKLAWPLGLAPTDLLDGGDNPWGWGLAASLLALAAVVAVLAALSRRRPAWGLAFASFAALLLPTLLFAGAGPVAAMDHHLYLPSLAFAPLVAAGLSRRPWGAALLAPLLALSVLQASYWHDSETLWARVLSVRPLFPAARLNLAAARGSEGRYPEALVAVDAQLRVYPGDASAARLRAELLERAGPTPAARARLESDAAAWLLEQGRAAEAAAYMEHALSLSPRDAELLVNAALLDGALGRRTRARRRLVMARRLAPRDARAAEALRRLDAAEGR